MKLKWRIVCFEEHGIVSNVHVHLSLLDWPSWKQLYLQRMKATLTFHVDIYDQANMMKFFLQRYRIRTEQSTQLYM